MTKQEAINLINKNLIDELNIYNPRLAKIAEPCFKRIVTREIEGLVKESDFTIVNTSKIFRTCFAEFKRQISYLAANPNVKRTRDIVLKS